MVFQEEHVVICMSTSLYYDVSKIVLDESWIYKYNLFNSLKHYSGRFRVKGMNFY